MSQSFGCKCPERKKPIIERNWWIVDYKCNHSAFNGWHRTSSDYSSLRCASCGAIGRTKAQYVDTLAAIKAFGWGPEKPKGAGQ